jgi:hypothetical protein
LFLHRRKKEARFRYKMGQGPVKIRLLKFSKKRRTISRNNLQLTKEADWVGDIPAPKLGL